MNKLRANQSWQIYIFNQLSEGKKKPCRRILILLRRQGVVQAGGWWRGEQREQNEAQTNGGKSADLFLF